MNNDEVDRREYTFGKVTVEYDVDDTWVFVKNNLDDCIEFDVSELDELIRILQEAKPLLRQGERNE